MWTAADTPCAPTGAPPPPSDGLLQHVITSQADYAAKVLGRPVQDAAYLPPHAVVIARQREPGIASGGQASCSFELVLTQPAVVADQQGLLEVGCCCDLRGSRACGSSTQWSTGCRAAVVLRFPMVLTWGVTE